MQATCACICSPSHHTFTALTSNLHFSASQVTSLFNLSSLSNCYGRQSTFIMDTSSPFTYSSLNTFQSEIRLISLQPSRENDSIECTLSPANLDERPSYAALSYEWGLATVASCCEHITLNGRDYPVRKNLWLALYHLRLEDCRRTIWVDSLCINQEDVRERNHQVALMGRIYSQASSVIAWLRVKDSDDIISQTEDLISILHPCYRFGEIPFLPERWLEQLQEALSILIPKLTGSVYGSSRN